MPASPIFDINKKTLKKYYLKDKMSMVDIARLFGCSHSTIVNRVKAYGIKSRGHLGLRRPLKITKEGLEKQYNRGLSLKKISRMFQCSEGGIERRFKKYGLVSRDVTHRACKYLKHNFSGDLIEKAYVVGFRLGDLNVSLRKNVIQIRCSTTCKAQIILIKKLFSTYTAPHVWLANRGTHEIVCLVNKSFSFLLPKYEKIPYWILSEQETFFSFFAGYTDAEGSFYLKRPNKTGKTWSSSFEIQTQQKQVILDLWENIKKYKIFAQLPKISRRAGTIQKSNGNKNNKDMWKFSVDRKFFLFKLIEHLEPYLKHTEKLRKIEEIKRNIVLRNQIRSSSIRNSSLFSL